MPQGGCESVPASLRAGPQQDRDLQPGRRLGPFELIERLGQGGQGEVWKTRRAGPDGELVALKVLKPELAHNPVRTAQFRREARRGPRLKGPSLLAAQELGLFEGFHCMAMPFVECTSLRDVIKWRVSYLTGGETEHFIRSWAWIKRSISCDRRALAQAAAALALRHRNGSSIVTSSRQTFCSTTGVEGGVYLVTLAWGAIWMLRRASKCGRCGNPDLHGTRAAPVVRRRRDQVRHLLDGCHAVRVAPARKAVPGARTCDRTERRSVSRDRGAEAGEVHRSGFSGGARSDHHRRWRPDPERRFESAGELDDSLVNTGSLRDDPAGPEEQDGRSAGSRRR